jgi:hypothetical protein
MTKVILNEEGFVEQSLPCGCVMTHITGFGWSTELCSMHEEESEDNKNFVPEITKMRRSNEY